MYRNRKLKILCLHGYRQDADSFREKVGSFRKSLKNIADFVFINSPHIIPSEQQADAVYGNNILSETNCIKSGRSWWFNSDNRTFSSQTKSEHAVGFKESLDVINDAFQSLGPFDGIFGFSQGASLVSLICGLKEHKEFSFNFHFAIIVAGFPSAVKSHQYLYDKIITTESLHIIGKSDTCIPKEQSENLAARFHSPIVVHHDGGHFVPSHSDIRNECKEFLEKFLDKITNVSPNSNV